MLQMVPSQACLEFVESCESCRLEAYPALESTPDDPKWAIGYGYTAPSVRPGDVWTKDQATAQLYVSIRTCADEVCKAVTVPALTQGQFDALVSFAYNTKWQAFRQSTLLRKVNASDFAGAAEEFLKWNHAAGKVLVGLTKRRESERAMFLGDSNAA